MFQNLLDAPKRNQISHTLNEDSSFNTIKQKRIKRKMKTHRRKYTQIIHTSCITKKMENGEIEISYHQKIVSSFQPKLAMIKKDSEMTHKKHTKEILSRNILKASVQRVQPTEWIFPFLKQLQSLKQILALDFCKFLIETFSNYHPFPFQKKFLNSSIIFIPNFLKTPFLFIFQNKLEEIISMIFKKIQSIFLSKITNETNGRCQNFSDFPIIGTQFTPMTLIHLICSNALTCIQLIFNKYILLSYLFQFLKKIREFFNLDLSETFLTSQYQQFKKK